MKYLVTGGAGFIGSNLIEHLFEIDVAAQVVVVDNLSTGKMSNIEQYDVTMYETNVSDTDSYKHELASCDVVYHLAATANVFMSVTDTLTTLNNNVVATVALFEAIKEVKPSVKVIQASSAAVYGESKGNEAIMETAMLNPESPYAADKITVEYYAKVYNHLHGLQITTVRPFNVYGKNQSLDSSYAGVITIFANKLVNGEDLTVFGDGLNTRDYVYIKDFVRALKLLIDGENAIYNIGNGNSVSVNEVIEILFDVANTKTGVVYTDERPGDIKHSLSNPEKLQSLGFSCEYDIVRGLTDYYSQLK